MPSEGFLELVQGVHSQVGMVQQIVRLSLVAAPILAGFLAGALIIMHFKPRKMTAVAPAFGHAYQAPPVPFSLPMTQVEDYANVAATGCVDSSSSVISSEVETDESLIATGEYLVHHVAMCVQCHTPRDSRGNLENLRLLRGAIVPIESPFAVQNWAFRAPKLAGLPAGWNEDALVHLLETGRTERGRILRPPMPPFRMSNEHAKAIAAYLKSLVP